MLLRLPSRSLETSQDDQRDRVDIRNREASKGHQGSRLEEGGPSDGIQTYRSRADAMAEGQLTAAGGVSARGRDVQEMER